MSLFAAVHNCLRMSFDGGGRAPRSEYWWWRLFFVVMVVVLVALAVSFETFWPVPIGFLLMLPADAAVTVRRLHDAGHPGWLAWLMFVPFGVVVLAALAALPGDPGENRSGPPVPYRPIFEPSPISF